MRTIRQGARFRRDFKRELRGKYRDVLAAEFAAVLSDLVDDRALPTSKRDHALIGDYMGCRDCHIRPDLVLIYRKPEPDVLELVRLGTHSELDL